MIGSALALFRGSKIRLVGQLFAGAAVLAAVYWISTAPYKDNVEHLEQKVASLEATAAEEDAKHAPAVKAAQEAAERRLEAVPAEKQAEFDAAAEIAADRAQNATYEDEPLPSVIEDKMARILEKAGR